MWSKIGVGKMKNEDKMIIATVLVVLLFFGSLIFF